MGCIVMGAWYYGVYYRAFNVKRCRREMSIAQTKNVSCPGVHPDRGSCCHDYCHGTYRGNVGRVLRTSDGYGSTTEY